MKQLPLGVQSFEKMISQNFLYIDKTEQIYKLITSGTYYFLSRPRRFGKSLLVSALKELFLGNKKLFENLWIGKNTDYAWPEHPVIHIDFSQIPRYTAQELRESLNVRLMEIAKEQNLAVEIQKHPEETLRLLIKEMAKRNSVVVLIDEYDKPILDKITDLPEARALREVLKNFYTILKGMDEYIKFVLLTGVTKFSKASVFSGLNNLNDISMDPRAAALLGYTDQEIDTYLNDYIEAFAQGARKSVSEIREDLRHWYNGYRFSESQVKVYNPFSVLFCLEKKKFENYWISSGNPQFLIDLIKLKREELIDKGKVQLRENSLGSFDIDNLSLDVVLFQAGYYTILDYDSAYREYSIGYPNYEVKDSFVEYLMIAFTDTDASTVETVTSQAREALVNNDLNKFCHCLRTLFAHIPYNLHLKHEFYYHSLFQLLGTMLHLETTSEVPTDKGRVDVTIITSKYIYIFEIKFNKKSGDGMEQIERRRYYEKYMHQQKQIILAEILFVRTEHDFTIEYKVKDLLT